MKYANLSDHISNSVNYGDYLQFIAVENVYKHLGIEEKDIFYISGKDIETYATKEELLEKVRYFLSHENERETVARNGFDTCLHHYTAKAAYEKILGYLGL